LSNVALRNLSGGEIAPALYGRVDYQRYSTSARTMRNFLCLRSGGVANRPGTEFIVETRDAGKKVRLVKFVFNNDQTYVLEFGEFYIRFIRDGAQLAILTVPYEIATPYLEDDLMELQFVQSADVLTIVHQDYAPYELSRLGDTSWTLTQVVFGPSIGSVANLSATGGIAGVDTYYAVTAIDERTGEEGLASYFTLASFEPDAGTPITVSWDPLSGAGSYNVYRSRDGNTYELIQGAAATPTIQTDSTWTDDIADITTSTEGSWQASADSAENPVIAGGLNKPYNNRFTFKGILTVTTSVQGAASGRLQAYYQRDAETPVLAGTIASAGTIGDGISGSSYSEVFTGSITVPDNGYMALILTVVPEVWGANGAVGEVYECFADFQTGTTPYNRIEWSILGTGFIDDNSEGDPLQTPPLDRQLFNSPTDYPAATTIYQQRRIFGNTEDEPEANFASRTGAYRNFLISNPLQDDDAVTWSNAGRQVNRVLHYLDLGNLIVFTSGSEMVVRGDEAGILRPDAINPQTVSYHGSGRLPPLPIDKEALFLQARGTRVRVLIPNGENNFDSNELTLLASHLFDGFTIEDWDYAGTPQSIVWAARSDGTLLGLTYLPSQDIWGWHRHDTDGVIERVCTVPEDDEDAVYLVVKRNIDGSDVRYIERMHSRFFRESDGSDAVFLDSSLTYDGAPATAISGLDHLEGEDVAVMADGIVVANPNDPDNADLDTHTVTAGAITLSTAASLVHVGLPYFSDLETLDIDSVGRSIKDKKILVNKVTYVLEKSREFYTGKDAPTDDATDPIEGLSRWERKTDEDDASPAVLTTDVDVVIERNWDSNGRVFARVIDPVPVTILAVIPQGLF
jgi:hypothetical protein